MTNEEKQEIVKLVLKELNKPVKLPVEMVDGAPMPFYAHLGDAGMDLRANEDVEIKPGETKIIKTGFKAVIPAGYEIQIRGRSGMNAKTPLKVMIGTIDEGYRGEYGVVISNISPTEYKDEHYTIDDKGKLGTFHIRKGDRIAQIVMSRYATMDLQLVESVEAIGENRGGGFGSTGTK